MPPAPTVPVIESVGFTTTDAEAAAAFFRRELGFQAEGGAILVPPGPYTQLVGLPGARLKLVHLRLGSERLELSEVLDPGRGARAGRPLPAESRSCDRWFQHICVVVDAMEAASTGVRRRIAGGALVAISSAPQRLPAWNRAAAGIEAFKFHDPEGHPIELLQFPADKGDPRWHRLPGRFKGLDHSAIAVADTARTARFYGNLLGFHQAADGINQGPEQERLDGLPNVQVRITAHRAARGMGLEALEYLAPNRGRPMPADLGFQDLAHWQVRVRVDDLDGVAEQVSSFGGTVLSPGIVSLAEPWLEAGRALQIADPDGHRLQLVAAP
ncbi:VOC family protein [Synechococcus sp. CCY 9618]|uniref:VOC family protein n=1 Tax=Synechococcus sp. CCY 9618 TaxID=2815602 RepID=UPI001C22C11E|nr:VOC family protein [Synechococcus sp. CCY 9618]